MIRNTSSQVHPTVTKQQYDAYNAWHYDRQWQTKLCSCQVSKRCCYAWFCSCCMGCDLAKHIGEKSVIGCFPCSLSYLRTKLRIARRIEGSCCGDYWASNCCMACTAIQMANELESLGMWNVRKSKKTKRVRIDHSNQYNEYD